jgi:hypothetical protein
MSNKYYTYINIINLAKIKQIILYKNSNNIILLTNMKRYDIVCSQLDRAKSPSDTALYKTNTNKFENAKRSKHCMRKERSAYSDTEHGLCIAYI